MMIVRARKKFLLPTPVLLAGSILLVRDQFPVLHRFGLSSQLPPAAGIPLKFRYIIVLLWYN